MEWKYDKMDTTENRNYGHSTYQAASSEITITASQIETLYSLYEGLLTQEWKSAKTLECSILFSIMGKPKIFWGLNFCIQIRASHDVIWS